MAKAKKKRKTKKSQSAPSFGASPWLRISSEVGQGPDLRRPLIKKIENHIKAKVIVFFTSFYKEEAMIVDGDAEMIENVLSAEHEEGKFLLILNSAGGFGLAAERIVNVCRAYSGGEFEVIIPHMAKSAATLICFGASCIHMSPTAELGPVDPQLKYTTDEGKEKWISAEEYITSYQDLLKMAISGKAKRIEALIQQLARYDARHMEQLKSEQALSQHMSVKLLKSGMMSNLTENTIKKKIEDFLIHKKTAAHGRMITMDEAIKCGLNIQAIELRSELWSWIWELYIRGDYMVSTHKNKLIESSRTSLSV